MQAVNDLLLLQIKIISMNSKDVVRIDHHILTIEKLE